MFLLIYDIYILYNNKYLSSNNTDLLQNDKCYNFITISLQFCYKDFLISDPDFLKYFKIFYTYIYTKKTAVSQFRNQPTILKFFIISRSQNKIL